MTIKEFCQGIMRRSPGPFKNLKVRALHAKRCGALKTGLKGQARSLDVISIMHVFGSAGVAIGFHLEQQNMPQDANIIMTQLQSQLLPALIIVPGSFWSVSTDD